MLFRSLVSSTTFNFALLITMKFFAAVATLVFAASAVLAAPSATTTVTVSYDQTYDVASNSLDIVACSNGPNGLESKGQYLPWSLRAHPEANLCSIRLYHLRLAPRLPLHRWRCRDLGLRL